MAPAVFTRLLAVIVTAALLGVPGTLWAQAQQSDEELAPPHLSLVDGSARLERAGDVVRAEVGHILAVGDRLRTDSGRVEIVFGDGTVLHIDVSSTVDVLDDWLLRLLEGRVFLHVATPPDDLPLIAYRIDTPAVSVRAVEPGEYRVEILDRAGTVTDVAVARGVAEVITDQTAVALHAGERVQTIAGQAPGFATVYNAAAWDSFDRWSYDRRRGWTDGPDTAYLPRQLAPYNSTLATYGTWSHHATYGAVWYPRTVAGWRPFYHGSWTAFSPYGWTWAGYDPWVWPTHYYGSWGLGGGRWFWIPGSVWSPARVHWAVSVGFVGWLPFGPVVHHVGWTVVPRSVFHVNVIVPRHSVDVFTLHSDVRRTFVAERPPAPRNVAVPRASVIDSSRVAVPRRAAAPAAPDDVTAARTAGRRLSAGSADAAPPRDTAASRAAVPSAGRSAAADRTGRSAAVTRATPSSEASGTSASRTGVSRVPSAARAAPTPEASSGANASRSTISRVPSDARAVPTPEARVVPRASAGAGSDSRAAISRRSNAARSSANTPDVPDAARAPDATVQRPSTDAGRTRAVPRAAPSIEPSRPSTSDAARPQTAPPARVVPRSAPVAPAAPAVQSSPSRNSAVGRSAPPPSASGSRVRAAPRSAPAAPPPSASPSRSGPSRSGSTVQRAPASPPAASAPSSGGGGGRTASPRSAAPRSQPSSSGSSSSPPSRSRSR